MQPRRAGPVSQCGPSHVGTGSRAFKLDLLATIADQRGVGKVAVVGEVKSGQERPGHSLASILGWGVLR